MYTQSLASFNPQSTAAILQSVARAMENISMARLQIAILG